MSHKYTNALIHATSPYLLQHAHNPVNWQPWDDYLVKKGDLNQKLLLISIGYAACHWCHVMEKESFEDEAIAEIMNEKFTCIKVDREERPDVDNYYMTAVHLMGLQGGWPLNVIALPDGRPIWGGTYFPKNTWMNNITAVARFWQENKQKALDYAQNLQSGIEESRIPVAMDSVPPVNSQVIEKAVNEWKKRFDFENGGRIGSPKFPLPVNLDFLLYYATMKNDMQVIDYVDLTLRKMAFGGIYDQVGGGFARYATDEMWKVPHFEKMLYDNGQLITTYARAYQLYNHEVFKDVVYETTAFIEREMMTREGAFYSSLDADSEGEEGKFYIWNKQELKNILKNDFELFSSYFNVNPKGLWEQGNYILLRDMTDENFAVRHDLDPLELKEKINHWKQLLLQERSKRIRPGLDDKTLVSWNALVILGLTAAYKAFSDEYFKKLALKNAFFIKQHMMHSNSAIYHSWKQGKNTISGFLDDYALVIQAYIALFEITGEEDWLQVANQLLDFSFKNFYDPHSGLFYYSAKEPPSVITNHFQIEDNVIPAANSVMAHNLHSMYLLHGQPDYREKTEKMLVHIVPHFIKYPQAFAHWGTLMLKLTENHYEVAICGDKAKEMFLDMQSGFHPNVLWAMASKQSNLPLLKDRYRQGENLIYVCSDGTCQLPVKEVREAKEQIGWR